MNPATTPQPLQGGQFVVWLASQYHPINFAFMARIRGGLTPRQVQQALDKLRIKYPPLSMRVGSESDGSVYLISDPALRFPVRSVARDHAERWIAEVTTELGQAFDLFTQPPLRLVLLQDEELSEILFVCPHVLADGLAVAYLVRDFLAFLGNPAAEEVAMPLAPPMSTLIPDFPGKRMVIWRAKLKAGLFKLLLRHGSKTDEAKTEAAHCVAPPYHLCPWVLTAEQTAALAARSRAADTTVHAALCVAFLRAFGECCGDGWKRTLQSPVNLRDRLRRPVGESFGLFVNLVEFSVNCAPERDFWEVAREIKQAFTRRSADKHIFNSLIEANVAMPALRAVITPKIVAQSFMTVKHDLSISNLGRLDFPVRYGALELDALFGPILGDDPEDRVLGVVTIGGVMHLSLSFTDSKMSPAQAEQLKESAMDWLAQAANG